MKLADWLTQHEMTMAAFGAELGVTHGTVSRWCSGTVFPAWDTLIRIERATFGKVTSTDFLAQRAGNFPSAAE